MKNIAVQSIAVPLLVFAVYFVSPGVLAQALLGPGDAFPPFHATDQHGAPYTFEPGTRVVLIAFEMSTAKAANRYLAVRPEGFLDAHKVVYIANIYGMPGIGRHFALPKMRRYPHRIVLGDSADLLAPFPHQEARVTMLTLDDEGMIRAVRYWNPDEALMLP